MKKLLNSDSAFCVLNSTEMILRFTDCVLDTDARLLLRGTEEVHLSPKAFELLELLAERQPRAVAKQELYDLLWPETFVVEASLPVLVREIRAALGDDDHQIIRTIHRFGYAFAADVREPKSGSGPVLVFGERQFPLADGENVIGRESAADVCLPSTTVSRRHAIITIAGDAATLTDLDSKNGTRVAGRELHGSTPLSDGTLIRFGGVEVVYRASGAAPTETLHDGR